MHQVTAFYYALRELQRFVYVADLILSANQWLEGYFKFYFHLRG